MTDFFFERKIEKRRMSANGVLTLANEEERGN